MNQVAKSGKCHCVGLLQRKGDKIYVYDRDEWRDRYGQRCIQTHSVYKDDGLSPTITAGHGCGGKITHDGNQIRRMTPREAWRAMGFSRRKAGGGWDDRAFEKASKSGMTEGQLNSQAGNSIAVPVMTEIMRNIKTFDDKSRKRRHRDG